MILHSAGENSLILYLGEETSPAVSARVQAAAAAVESALGPHLIDLVPSYASLLIIYDAMQTDHLQVSKKVREVVANIESGTNPEQGRTVVLPVYYAPEAGEDLESLAQRSALTTEEVIRIHSQVEYRVYAIGFAPGFAYLGQVDERIAAPRLQTPRTRVPRGAVAIADRQTAVYPAESPGGWNLIGRCPVPMFDPASDPIMPVRVGDKVRFEAIDRQRFLQLGGKLG